ncbi:protein BUNDLE SHEATH DEFECTIVE 2, chloroplastic-like [Rutidosis leptorrhynchoides]|uniref:protein BUNDLE SHEATH DEFECTIVE 2, chloroplastic-like n=1 Tax=Rutidosis leptorrhynchoides TaxID=125765 RepID=UPI003A999AE8
MSITLCCSSFISPNKPRIIGGNSNAPKVIFVSNLTNQNSKTERFHSLEVKATNDTKSTTKVNSIVCESCEGNSAIQCTQCKGNGVNLEDHFNGRFKAGGLCWLCRGKKEILCGNCNGAGFCGGFMSTSDQ